MTDRFPAVTVDLDAIRTNARMRYANMLYAFSGDHVEIAYV